MEHTIALEFISTKDAALYFDYVVPLVLFDPGLAEPGILNSILPESLRQQTMGNVHEDLAQVNVNLIGKILYGLGRYAGLSEDGPPMQLFLRGQDEYPQSIAKLIK